MCDKWLETLREELEGEAPADIEEVLFQLMEAVYRLAKAVERQNEILVANTSELTRGKWTQH